MKKGLLALAAIALSAAPSFASYITLTDSVGSPTATTVAPGDSFTIVSTLVTNAPTAVMSYFIDASAGNVFNLTARTIAGTNPFPDLQTANPTGILNTTTPDLGGLATNVAVDSPAGTYDLGTLTFSVAPTTPVGVYTLSITSASIVNDSSFVNETTLDPLATYTITVAVPEPTSLAGIGVGLMMLARRSRKA